MRRRSLSSSDVVSGVFAGASALMAAALMGGFAYDQIHRHLARPTIERSWGPARRAVAARLKQSEPLEFGAVWATHSGMICGLVNGWSSFGGLTGMTPFAADGGRAVFLPDVGPLAFAPYWRRCMTDRWITLQEGSMQTGYCATRLGQAQCPTVTG